MFFMKFHMVKLVTYIDSSYAVVCININIITYLGYLSIRLITYIRLVIIVLNLLCVLVFNIIELVRCTLSSFKYNHETNIRNSECHYPVGTQEVYC